MIPFHLFIYCSSCEVLENPTRSLLPQRVFSLENELPLYFSSGIGAGIHAAFCIVPADVIMTCRGAPTSMRTSPTRRGSVLPSFEMAREIISTESLPGFFVVLVLALLRWLLCVRIWGVRRLVTASYASWGGRWGHCWCFRLYRTENVVSRLFLSPKGLHPIALGSQEMVALPYFQFLGLVILLKFLFLNFDFSMIDGWRISLIHYVMFSKFLLIDYFVSLLFRYSGDCHFFAYLFGQSCNKLFPAWLCRWLAHSLSVPTPWRTGHYLVLSDGLRLLTYTGLVSSDGISRNLSAQWGQTGVEVENILGACAMP